MIYRNMTIREIREARGLSQAEAARRAGINASTLNAWEKNENRRPKTVTAFNKLMKVYGITLSLEALQKLSVGLDAGAFLGKVKFTVKAEEVEE